IDGGVRATAALFACWLACLALLGGCLSLFRHIVELPRWGCQLTALHLNVASTRHFNTNQPRGSFVPAAEEKPNHETETLADSAVPWVNTIPTGPRKPVVPLAALWSDCPKNSDCPRNHVATCLNNGRRRRHRPRICAGVCREWRESLRL